MPYPIVILKPKRAASVLRKHPWVFSGAISKIIIPEGENEPQEGDWVEVRDNRESFLAFGHFGSGSIAVRILSFENTSVDQAFWESKIQAAFDLRKSLALIDSKSCTAYRLIHAEGDGLPGLIIDIYGDTAIIQAHSLGMFNSREAIANALKKVYGKKLNAVYCKSEATLPKEFSKSNPDGYLWQKGQDQKDSQVILENDLKFDIDWVHGQKTGFFIDQRENRKLLREFSKGKKVLNTFCYSGGFSVYALAGGASEVISVDSSAKAIDLCEQNVALNFKDKKNHKSVVADTLTYLNDCDSDFDLMVLDPPAYAKNKSSSHNAIQGYRRLNEKAIRLIKPGGILFTFSCSQVIHRKLFEDTVTAAAIDAGRSVKILAHLSQPGDHPVSIFHPEGAYLKGLVLYIN